MKDDKYYLHQTPETLAKKLIEKVDILPTDEVLEPFKGEGAFYNNLPNCIKHWTEIEEGRDYKTFNQQVDWVITNPPFKIDGVSAFFDIMMYYLPLVRKGICLLGHDDCFRTLTPVRLKKINDMGFVISKIYVCSIKKWRGRYYFIKITKNGLNTLEYIEGNY